MYELFELVCVEGAEVWSPISKLGAVMQLDGEPQLGDFMAVQNGITTFLCPEATRVRVKKLEGSEIQFEIGRGIPNWFREAQSLLRVTQQGFFLRAQKLKVGDEIVYDGLFITVETPSEIPTN